MGYRFNNHFKLVISTVEKFSDVFQMISTMPVDGTTQIKFDYKVIERDGEPDLEINSITIEFSTLYLSGWESQMYEWALALVKEKQRTVSNHQTRYGFFQYNMDTDSSMFGIQTYDLLWRSDEYRPPENRNQKPGGAVGTVGS